MEHRWGNRIDCNVAVKLLADPASIAWGRIRNISGSGAFIETQLRVRSLSMLNVWRTVDRKPVRDAEAIRAIVVRRDANGIGIEWMEGDSPALAAILQEVTGRSVLGALLPQPSSLPGDASAAR